VGVRVPPIVKSAMWLKASAFGVSLSDYVRGLIYEDLGVDVEDRI